MRVCVRAAMLVSMCVCVRSCSIICLHSIYPLLTAIESCGYFGKKKSLNPIVNAPCALCARPVLTLSRYSVFKSNLWTDGRAVKHTVWTVHRTQHASKQANKQTKCLPNLCVRMRATLKVYLTSIFRYTQTQTQTHTHTHTAHTNGKYGAVIRIRNIEWRKSLRRDYFTVFNKAEAGRSSRTHGHRPRYLDYNNDDQPF